MEDFKTDDGWAPEAPRFYHEVKNDDDLIEVSFDVDEEGLQLLMKDFETDDPITALQYTID